MPNAERVLVGVELDEPEGQVHTRNNDNTDRLHRLRSIVLPLL